MGNFTELARKAQEAWSPQAWETYEAATNYFKGNTLGIDYSSGAGYGIAVELHEDTEENLIRMFNDMLDTNVDPEDGIYEFQGEKKLTEMGLEVDHVGNSWSGSGYHVIILLHETSQSHDHRDAGVWMVDGEASGTHRLDPVIAALNNKGIEFRGPGWMVHKSVH